MERSDDNAFSLLARPVLEAVRERGFTAPTEPQAQAIPKIMAGENVLLISPTASGKTEAAVLPILSRFMTSKTDEPGIAMLYISPLRALNRDLLQRLEWWCHRLDVRVAVRHGDTETKERGMQSKNPPDMLILTPETLQAIMPGRIMRRNLRKVAYVIVDEVHELAEDKRGSQLALALERLRWITGRDFQIVGLSATIGTPERVAEFLAGANRPVAVVRVPIGRRMRVSVELPQPDAESSHLARKLYTHPEVAARLKVMRGLIEDHQSVILFTNTRAVAEVLTSRFKVWDIDFPVSIHHGSLAKPSRISAEQGLKNGELRALVATSSLELGIDVGRVDFVIQYMSPRQVTRLIQRVGRSGHSVGRVAEGVIIAMDSDDALEALAIARRAMQEALEAVQVPEKPLDVLSHQIVGLLIQKSRWYIREILDIFNNAGPYKDLNESDLTRVVEYMHSRFPRLCWFSPQDQVILRPRRLKDIYTYYFGKLSMIPDEKQYLVVDKSGNSPIGVLDEAFVAEYGAPGTKFIVRGSPWKMESIKGETIYVRAITDPTGAIPSWIGEEIPVPYEIGAEVGEIRRYAVESLRNGRNKESIVSELSTRYPCTSDTIQRALSETFDQAAMGVDVPSDELVTIEDWDEYVVLCCHFGLRVNRTLARLVGHVLSEEAGSTVGVQQDAYRIVIHSAGAADAERVAKTLRKLGDMSLENLARTSSSKTGIFKRRMVHVAKRFGAISRWVDLSNVRLGRLMKTFEGTVIFEETMNETLRKDLDLPNTERVLSAIRDGGIKLTVLSGLDELTPIARLGIERISMKTDLIPSDKMKRILIDSARARILNESRTLMCTSCWNYAEIARVRDLPTAVKCPRCGSKSIAVLSCDTEELNALMQRKGRALTKAEKRIVEQASESASVVEKYGKAAVVVQAGRRLTPADARRILRREKRATDRLFELIMDAERQALRRRFL
jgi:ATP-dependent Lhr-like helicase